MCIISGDYFARQSKCHIFTFLSQTKTCHTWSNISPGPPLCISPEPFIDIKHEKVIGFNAEPLCWEVYFKLGLAFEMLVPSSRSGWGAGGAALAPGHPLEHLRASQSRQNVWSKASRCLTESTEPSESFPSFTPGLFALISLE